MPLTPERFTIDEYEFMYTPLMLKPARKLYGEVIQKYGPVIASFIEAFELPENIVNQNVDLLANSVAKSFGGAIHQLSASIDTEWIGNTMEKIIWPQLQVEIDGQMVPVTAQVDWYNLEFGTKCSVEIVLLFKILSIQYSDFFVRFKKVSSTIETIKKSLKNLNYQKG